MLRQPLVINRLGAMVAAGNGFTRSATQQVTVQATVSPMSPEAIKAAFDMTQGRMSYKVVSASRMFDFQSPTPDNIAIDGTVYECRSVGKSANNMQNHYTAIFSSKVSASGVK